MATQTELAEIWARKEGISHKTALKLVSSLVSTMKEMLIEGDELKIRGFLSARVDIVEARTLRDFMGKGKDIQIPQRHVLNVQVSGKFKREVQQQAI